MSQQGGGKPPQPVQKTIFGHAPGKGPPGQAVSPPAPAPAPPPQQSRTVFAPPGGPPPGYGPPPAYGPPPGAPPPQAGYGPPPGAPPPQAGYGPPPGAPPPQAGYGPPPGAPPPQAGYGPPMPQAGYGPPMPQPGAPMTFPFHAGARGAYMVVAVLLFILIVTFPIALWALVARSRGRIEVRGLEIVSYGFLSKRLDLSRARRLGVLQVPVYARGLGGAIARRKVGGDQAIHLCTMDEQGRKANMLVSMYERFPEIIDLAQRATGLPIEEVEVGVLGPKWPG